MGDVSTYLTADHIVFPTGYSKRPSYALLDDLEVDPNNQGIVVNSELQARSDIWVAGNAASFYDPALTCRRRFHGYHFDRLSGHVAGLNMVGSGKAIWGRPSYNLHLPGAL